MRQIVYDQYRLGAALNFMIHMTIKGFFKPKSDINRQNLIADLDRNISRYEPFPVYPGDLRIFDRDQSLVIDFPKAKNEILWQIQEDCLTCFEPYIATDCDFSPRELGEFTPHITISMLDGSLDTLNDAKDYLNDVRFNSTGYTVKNFRLFEFRSESWGTAGWIDSLNWKILHTWRLRHG
jgi:2'-5' RNA ligase